MDGIDPKELGRKILEKRGSMGVRAAAAEIGIGSATLSRLERGHTSNLETIKKVLAWLEMEIGEYFGHTPTSSINDVDELQIAFKKTTELDPDTARAMADLIFAAHASFKTMIGTERN